MKPKSAPTSTSRARPVFCSPATAPASAARASVRYTPSLRKSVRNALLLSASRMPRTDLPASVRPLYSKTGNYCVSSCVTERTSAMEVMPRKTFCAPSSIKVRMPLETACFLMVPLSTFFSTSWRRSSSTSIIS